MDSVLTYFPQAFFHSENLLEKEYLLKLQKKAKIIESKNKSGGSDWIEKPFNTHGSYSLQDDLDFKNLFKIIEEKIFKFTNAHNSNYIYKITESWINIYRKNELQEFHCHPNSTFSAVFFLKSSDACGRLIFENPIEPDMLPIKGIEEENSLTYKRVFIKPKENHLIVFRSYMRHMVERQVSDFERMTIAVNF